MPALLIGPLLKAILNLPGWRSSYVFLILEIRIGHRNRIVFGWIEFIKQIHFCLRIIAYYRMLLSFALFHLEYQFMEAP
jgi:hypothetical protein